MQSHEWRNQRTRKWVANFSRGGLSAGSSSASELISIHTWPTCLRPSSVHKASLQSPGCETRLLRMVFGRMNGTLEAIYKSIEIWCWTLVKLLSEHTVFMISVKCVRHIPF